MELFTNRRLGLAIVLSFVAVACAAPTIPNDQGGEETEEEPVVAGKRNTPSRTQTPAPAGTQTDTNPTNPTPSPTPNPTPNPTPTPTPTGACASSADGEACFNCCDQASGGELAKADEAFFTCACEGQCAAQCGATFCSEQGGQPSAACETCLTNTCEPAADAACTSAACKAGVQCMQTSCAGKM